MPETGSPGPRLVFTGNVVVDIVMPIAALPEPGGDAIAEGARLAAGGGWNTMVAAARDGLRLVFAGRYGTGPFGGIVAAALSGGEVEVAHPPVADVDSGFSVALVDPSAERTFVSAVGAEALLSRRDLDLVDVGEHDLVYVTGYSLSRPAVAEAISGWLTSLPDGARVVLDPSPLVGELPAEVLGAVLTRTDVLTANAREAGILSGRPTPAKAAAALAGRVRRGGSAVVRDGADGAWVAGSGEEARHVPSPAVDAVDANGAGDTHTGVLAAALSRGATVDDAVLRANAAAAISVTRRGPATAPRAEEIDALLARP